MNSNEFIQNIKNYKKMTPLEKNLEKLRDINNTIISLDNDVSSILSQNKNLISEKNELERQIKNLNKKNQNLIKTEKEYYLTNNESNITLGINNLSVRNTEAIHDALTFFDKKCPYCDKDLFVTTKRKQFEIDHFFPVSKGGQDLPWNLIPVCQGCNRKKKDTLPHKFLEINSFKKVSIYLNTVHEKFLSEAIDSYTFKEKISELIEKESLFVKNHLHSDFITSLLYLTENQSIIKNELSQTIEGNYNEIHEDSYKIKKYLNKEIPENWNSFNLSERIKYFEQIEDNKNVTPNLHLRRFVCIAEIWCECLGKKREDMNRYKTREINSLMKKLENWKLSKSTKNFGFYGKQKFYERKYKA